MKNWKNIDLTQATIFDFTEDIEMIRECINKRSFSMDDKDEYIKSLTKIERYQDLIDFASITRNSDMRDALYKAFPEEHSIVSSYFNE